MAYLIANLSKVASLVGNTASELFKNQTKVGDLIIDSTISFNIRYEKKITKHAIQEGGNITDHASIQQPVLTFEGSITSSSYDLLSQGTNISNLISNPAGEFSGRFLKKTQRQTVAYEILRDIFFSNQPITVVNYYDVFENMMIESWDIPRNYETGDRFAFSLTLVQVTFAQVENVSISNNPRPTQDLLSKKVNVGKQETTKADTFEEKKATAAVSIGRYFGF